MKQRGKSRVYAAVCALAIAGVAVDRVFLSEPVTGPRTSTAAVTADPVGPTAGVSPAQAEPAEPVSGPSISERLAQASEQLGLPGQAPDDAFSPDESVLAEPVDRSVGADQQAMEARRAIAGFLSAHRLQAVMTDAQGGYALIDGRTMRPGQTLEGCRLLALRPRFVVMSYQGQRFELRIDPPQER